jgi:DNA-binding IclR family transcriptional regulator
MGRHAKNGVKAVSRVVSILDALQQKNEAGVTELAEEIDLTKGTVHSYLASLEEHDFVTSEGGTYSLGHGTLQYGGWVLEQNRFYAQAIDHVRTLADRTGEIAALSIEEHGKNVYLAPMRGEEAINLDVRLGDRLPMHCVGSGKAILAMLPEERIHAIVDEYGLPSYTSNTITEIDRLLAELENIRERRVAFDNEERIEGVRSVAAPVVNDETDEVYGAITVSGPKGRMKGEWYSEELPEYVRDTAREISINLTYE